MHCYHDCPECGQTCYCDMEDHENELIDDCFHDCEEETFSYEDEGL